ncbi:sulfatase [Paenibacillus sp. 1P07SE]|uniref:sulfatase family protein n=1 Tax=Paenibacillus sp. 1P07SE TaxID=3132209 RepID=UPI0039A59D31
MPTQRKKAPNIVFIMSDQHRADILGSHRSELRTPHLDRLAKEGTSFNHCYTSAQACVPARACMMTGRYAELHRTFSNQEVMSEVETTWPEVLDRHGYQAVAVGRTHHIDKGFETVRVPYGQSYPMIDYNDVHEIPWGPQGFTACSPVPFEEFYEKKVADTAVGLMEDLGRNQPFAMYVGLLAPHPPFVLPEPFYSMYSADAIRYEPQAPPPAGSRIAQTVRRHYGEHLTEERQRQLQAAYYGMVSMMDACIGILLDGLDRLGLADDTIVIYTSDHGEQMGHRGLWNKGVGYDKALRVPLIIRQPGVVPADRTSEAMTEMVDLFPTILEGAGIPEQEWPVGRSGRSFWRAAAGETREHRDWVYSTLSNGRGQLYRDESWKLWYEVCGEGDRITELYDLKGDPEEQVNLYHDPDYAPVRDRIQQRLRDFSLTALHEGVSVLYPQATQAPTYNGQFKK